MEHPAHMNPDAPLALSGDPIFRVVGDEVFVLAGQGHVHWLKNPTARLIWDALAAHPPEGVTPSALAARVVAEFEVDDARALADVNAFLVALLERGLVAPREVQNGRPAPDSPPPIATTASRAVAPPSPDGDLIDSDPGQT